MPVEKVSYEEVSEAARVEKRNKSIGEVRMDLYPAYRATIEEIRSELAKEMMDNPIGTRAKMWGNQLTKLEEQWDQLQEFRTQKIMMMAQRAARTSKSDHLKEGKLTREERSLFDSVCEALRRHQEAIRSGAVTTPTAPAAVPVAKEMSMDMLMGGVAVRERPAELEEPEEVDLQELERPKEAERQPSEHILLRILEDIPDIASGERNYSLKKEDVITLPANIAKTLIIRKKAMPIQATEK